MVIYLSLLALILPLIKELTIHGNLLEPFGSYFSLEKDPALSFKN